MGIWYSHGSLGNMIGSLLSGAYVDIAWGWSFIVSGLLIGGMGILTFLFLIPCKSICELLAHEFVQL